MHCWLFLSVSVSSMILIKFAECCAVKTNLPIEKVLQKNEDSPWLVLIGDKTVQLPGAVHGLSYGAVIQSDIILTLAAAVFKTPAEDLIVMTRCSINGGVRCDTYPVTEMYFRPNSGPNHVNEDDPIILILTTPLELSVTVSTIKLAISNDDFDPDDCVIHHWQQIASYYPGRKTKTPDSGVLNAEFQVSLDPDRFGMSETEEAKMTDDNDCFLEWCLTEQFSNSSLINDSMQKINFIGSPIVCKLRNAEDQVMVGFSTYTYRVVFDADNTTNVSVANGTLVEFSSDLDNFFYEIMNA